MTQTKCDQFVALKMAAMINFEVIKQLNAYRKTIFNVWKNFQEEQTTLPNTIPGRHCSASESLKPSRG